MATTDMLELLHAATDRATIVTVPERRMFALDGLGDPAGAGYRHAIETLHAIADLLRAKLHVEDRVETRVGPIECAWWTHPEPPRDEVPERFADRATWHWQQMVEIPRQATDADAEAVLAQARSEGTIADAELIRVIRFDEGLSAQILHAGSRESEPDSVRHLFDAVYAAGLRPRGHLHEILVSDPLHAPVERRHSILRLPVKQA